jgi:hypothetical protein
MPQREDANQQGGVGMRGGWKSEGNGDWGEYKGQLCSQAAERKGFSLPRKKIALKYGKSCPEQSCPMHGRKLS